MLFGFGNALEKLVMAAGVVVAAVAVVKLAEETDPAEAGAAGDDAPEDARPAGA
ncbi:hypothetical protein [Streptomyces synnematoformans]|uniref:Uncharacterized protein n=1 Tax=Streptomyces synnematoformans TaxID=415721 RepID=A0ABP5JGF0_9ACTN